MGPEIPERDWKALRGMTDRLLQGEYERALGRLRTVLDRKGEQAHDTYRAIWAELRAADERIGRMFDDHRRSNALLKLAEMVRLGVLSGGDLEAFTEDTRRKIEPLANR